MSRGGSIALRAARVAALLLALLGAAGLVFQRCVREPEPAAAPAPPRAAPPAAAAPRGASVLQITGRVERSAGGERWTEVAPGDVVHEDQALRTGPGARADLALGPGARLQVDEETLLEVHEVSPSLHRVRLARGRLGVDYAEQGGRRLRVGGPDGSAAEARAARFSVVSAGDVLAVVTETGGVDLSSAAGAVHVAAGEQSSAAPGAAPARPAPIPARVLLEVAGALAPRSAAGAPCVRLAGRVQPGTEVRVDGEAVPIAADGTFDASPPPRPGARAVRIRARDAAGRVLEREVACRTSAPEPDIDLSVEWGRDAPR